MVPPVRADKSRIPCGKNVYEKAGRERQELCAKTLADMLFWFCGSVGADDAGVYVLVWALRAAQRRRCALAIARRVSGGTIRLRGLGWASRMTLVEAESLPHAASSERARRSVSNSASSMSKIVSTGIQLRYWTTSLFVEWPEGMRSTGCGFRAMSRCE